MQEGEATRPSLLIRIRNPRDVEAWQQFAAIYMPLIFRLLRRRGLQEADAADVSQDVLRTLLRELPRFEYDSGKGTFRAWLKRVATTRLLDFVRARSRRQDAPGGVPLEQFDQSARVDDDEWDREYERSVFEAAAAQVRGEFQPATWSAFWKTAVEGLDVAVVAQDLSLSAGAIYVARSRVTSRLKAVIATWEQD